MSDKHELWWSRVDDASFVDSGRFDCRCGGAPPPPPPLLVRDIRRAEEDDRPSTAPPHGMTLLGEILDGETRDLVAAAAVASRKMRQCSMEMRGLSMRIAAKVSLRFALPTITCCSIKSNAPPKRRSGPCQRRAHGWPNGAGGSTS